MAKTRVVLFGPVGARIVTTSNPKKYRKMNNAMFNPNLEAVRGVPPHFWVRQAGEIVEMSRPRKLARLARIDAMTRLQWGPRPTKPLVLSGLAGIVIGVAAYWAMGYWGVIEWLMK